MNQDLSTIESKIGLGANMAATATAISGAIAKSGMPPLQKAGLIVGSSIISGISHSAISSMNRKSVCEENITHTVSGSNSNIGSDVTKLVDGFSISPL